MVVAINKNFLAEEQLKLQGEAPSPMNTMLAKENPLEAIRRKKTRKNMTTESVPASLSVQRNGIQAKKRAPHCKSCGKPMKGHKNVKDCPKK